MEASDFVKGLLHARHVSFCFPLDILLTKLLLLLTAPVATQLLAAPDATQLLAALVAAQLLAALVAAQLAAAHC
jgi:hypothetical protein